MQPAPMGPSALGAPRWSPPNGIIKATLSPEATVGIAFTHSRKTVIIDGKKPGMKVPVYVDRTTTATLYSVTTNKSGGDDLTMICRGVAACSDVDNFVKETGRRLALTRALCSHFMELQPQPDKTKAYVCKTCGAHYSDVKGNPHFSRVERAKVWAAYHSRRTTDDQPAV